MSLEEMDELLKKSLNTKRYIHSVDTMKAAVSLAEHYGEDTDAAAISGLLHDCAKNLKDEETKKYCLDNGIEISEIEEKQLFLMHGAVGAVIAREKYGVEDKKILNAIKYHTTGCSNMKMIEKIVFIADYIEPGRTFPEAEEARKLAYEDIDKALIYSFDSIIIYRIRQNGLIHPVTIEARNSLLMSNR